MRSLRPQAGETARDERCVLKIAGLAPTRSADAEPAATASPRTSGRTGKEAPGVWGAGWAIYEMIAGGTLFKAAA
jgi:hypothetical protein